MSENTNTNETKAQNNQTSPLKNKFWIILGAGIILSLVYQSGRSAGIRLALESHSEIQATAASSLAPASEPTPKTAAETQTPTKTPPQRVRTAAKPQSSPANTPRQPQPATREFADIPLPKTSNSPAQLYQTREIAKPPKIIETGELLEPVIPPSSVPLHPAPINSVYHNRPSTFTTKPSEMGLIPLQPLKPLSEPLTIPAPVQIRTLPTPSPATTYRPATKATCDCGKAH